MEVNDDLNEAVSSEEHEEQEQSKEKEYLLSDGFGLDLEEVRTMIIKKCETKIEKDDPILMIVPILNAALTEQKKLNDEYKEGLKNVYQQVLDVFLENLDKRLQNGELKVKQISFTQNLRRFLNKNFLIQFLLGIIFLQTFFMIWFVGH